MVDTQTPFTTQPIRAKKSKLPIIIGIVVIGVLVFIGFSLFQSRKPVQKVVPLTDIKPPSPTPTFKPVDKASVRIQVVNGTGTPGQATSVVDALKKAGYNADNIKTGNADKFDSVVTTITSRTGFENAAADIKNSLTSTFNEININSTSLDDKSNFDIVILTGGKLFESPIPQPTVTGIQTATPTPTLTNTPTPSPTNTPTPSPTATP